MSNTQLQQTVLHDTHLRLGGRMVPFAGYDMPVQYEGILAEARAVRSGAGIFDVSHMGRFFVSGPEARTLLDWVHTTDIGKDMPVGRARYGLFCNEQGGIMDDGIIYRLAPERFLLVANAANAEKILAWVTQWRDEHFKDAAIEDVTRQVAMIALQGPKALDIITSISDFDPKVTRPFRIAEGHVQGKRALIARTGYTGEDGVEIMPASEDAPWLWDLLMEKGAAPCGLGARDTLRLEAALPLHGSDIDESINPIEAGLERFVALDKGDFCGRDAIRRAAEQGTQRRLIGFEMAERGAVPRGHASILSNGSIVGQVTSGGYSPTLDRNIGLGYVPSELAAPGTGLQIDVRGKLLDAQVVSLPFYTRPK